MTDGLSNLGQNNLIGADITMQPDEPGEVGFTGRPFSRRRLLGGTAAVVVAASIGGVKGVERLIGVDAAYAADDMQALLAKDPLLAVEAKPDDELAGTGESHGPELVDWLGATNFFAGVRDLMPGGKGHIDKTRYASLGALLALKYDQSDEAGRQHLMEEFSSVAMSGAVIEGTILASEALKLDFATAYQSTTDREIDARDTIPLLTMFSALTSPGVTTVGSSGILSKQAQQLGRELGQVRQEGVERGLAAITTDDSKKDEAYRILTAQVSNLSGFWLFGDPPFIAMAEKYGLAQAVGYQIHACLPLALQSLYASNQQLQKLRLSGEGVNGMELERRSRVEAVTGMWRNKDVLVSMCSQSALNVAKVMAFQKGKQNDGGIQFDFTGMIRDKVHGAMQLMFQEHIPSHEAHEATGARTIDVDPNERSEATSIALKLAADLNDEEGALEHTQHVAALVNDLAMHIDAQDYQALEAMMAQHGMEQTEVREELERLRALARFREQAEFGRLDDKDIQRKGWLGRIATAPKRFLGRITHLDRIKNALGHASADVLNVFPFQALSVPFLVPIFRSAVENATQMLETAISDDQRFLGLDATRLRELAVANMTAVLVTVKSSVADNYVAAKIGLELLPDKPSYPLIAAISGGRLTAIGNMANPTLIPLAEYGMAQSIKKIPRGLPSVLFHLTWANLLELKRGSPGFPTPPEPKK